MIRREFYIAQAVAIVLLGLAVGAVDGFVLRPVRLQLEVADPSQFLPPDAPVAINPPTPAQPNGTSPLGPSATEPERPIAMPPPATVAPAAAPKSSQDSNHITMDQAWAFYQRVDRGEAFFVDARRFDLYEEGHVASAIPMNLKSFDTGKPPQVDVMDPSQPVVVYCGGGDCDESVAVARMLNQYGFRAIFIMHDGFPAWQQRNYPVETGKHPLHDAANFR